jgi:glutamine amidotransferase
MKVKPLIAVVDYEMGNLHSVGKALEKAGGRIQITNSPSVIRRAAGVVLPGVGAFGEAMKRLASKKLIAPICETLQKNKPFFGICLGLQLLFERSEECAREKGFGFFKGSVVRFQMPRGSSLKVPHMGWNQLRFGPASKTRALRGVSKGDYFYFVHSFFPAPRDRAIVATRTPYGRLFCSSIARGRLFASQFHPEKSGDQGQRVLRNFVREVSLC